MKKLIEKYGFVNCIFTMICIVLFVINSLAVDKGSLTVISDNLISAFILNFFAGDKGLLIQWGSMSFEKAISNGQVWRIFTHIYLHAGFIHMAMNLLALLIAGKYVEKKYGSIWYGLFFHSVAMADAMITALIFPSESVGASAGIFASIGVLVILLCRKQIAVKKSELTFLILFFVLSLTLGVESLVTHLSALLIGLVIGVLVKKNG